MFTSFNVKLLSSGRRNTFQNKIIQLNLSLGGMDVEGNRGSDFQSLNNEWIFKTFWIAY